MVPMLFWIAAAALTLAASLAVLVPLTRRTADAEPTSRHDIEVYRDQLQDYFTRAVARGGHTPHLLEEAFSWHIRRLTEGSMQAKQ